jgi:hypothetical protein
MPDALSSSDGRSAAIGGRLAMKELNSHIVVGKNCEIASLRKTPWLPSNAKSCS